MTRRLLWLAAGGLAIRLAVAPWTSWVPDMLPWVARAREVSQGTPLYANLDYSYPPLYAYIIALFTAPASLLGGIESLSRSFSDLNSLAYSTNLIDPTITSPLFNVSVKLPAILADVGIALALHVLARDVTGSQRTSERVAALWLFNPVAIWVCAVHGQFDTIPAFLTVLALGQMWRHQWFGAGIALSVGALFKLYPAYLLLAAAVFIGYDAFAGRTGVELRRKLRAAVHGWVALSIGTLVPVLMFVPPLIGSRVLTNVFSRAQTQTTGSGLDLWFPSTLPPLGSFLGAVSTAYSALLTVLLYVGAVVLLVVAYPRWARDRRRVMLETVIGLLALLLLCAPNTNPQFMVWLLPLLILGARLGCSYRLSAVIALSTVPVLFYIAQWGGNPLEMAMPAVTYLGFPVSPGTAAASLSLTVNAPGPLGYQLRLWMMVVVAGAIVVALASVVRPPGFHTTSLREMVRARMARR